jgi:dihydropteroate synthase
VDTSKAEVARACLEAGAAVVNDVAALRGEGMVEVARSFGAGVILMHMQGSPATMQEAPHYGDVLADLARFFQERLDAALRAGIGRDRIALDPGIGFGKTDAHNRELLTRLGEFQRFGRPVCLGVSRKGWVGRLLGGRDVGARRAGSLALACYAMGRGSVQVLRVHDVEETRDAVAVFAALGAGDDAGTPGG